MAEPVWMAAPGPPGRRERKAIRELTAVRVLRERLEWQDLWVRRAPQESPDRPVRSARKALPDLKGLRGPRGMRVRRPKPARRGSQVRS
jgi:hypothetical protein